MSKWAIFDLDNCLANDAWRISRIDWTAQDPDARYAAYHAAAIDDALNPVAYSNWTLAQRLGLRIAVLTARPVEFREQTLRWLSEHLQCEPDALLMRNAGDHRHSRDLKREQLAHLREYWGAERIVAAWDDRPDVIEMYLAEGVESAAVLACHTVCAYTPPRPGAAALLDAAAATFRQRNALYGDNYKRHGALMRALFPGGVELLSAEDFNRYGVLVQCASKLSRYTENFSRGGHQDSARDLAVYAAMLEELTNEDPE